eukprot:1138037-Pelagomonas_calceolata.AAC.2
MDARVLKSCVMCLHSSESMCLALLVLFMQAEVSDTAAGGQILMEGSTFSAIKDVLGELGTVDAQVDSLEPSHRKAGQFCTAGKSNSESWNGSTCLRGNFLASQCAFRESSIG